MQGLSSFIYLSYEFQSIPTTTVYLNIIVTTNANMQGEEQYSQFSFFAADFEELLSTLEINDNDGKVEKNESHHDYEKEVPSFDEMFDHEKDLSEISHMSRDTYSTYNGSFRIGKNDPLFSGGNKTLNDSNEKVTEVTFKDMTYSNISPSPSERQFSIPSEPLDASVAADSATTCSPVYPTPSIAKYIDGSSKFVTNSLAHIMVSPSPITQEYQSTEVMRVRSNSVPYFRSFKKYVCQVCEKGFKRPSSLSTHMNIHTGQKPYLCPLISCGKAFNAKSNMLRHHKIHFKTSSGEYILPNGEVISAKPTSRQLLLDPGFHLTIQRSPTHKRESSFERRSF